MKSIAPRISFLLRKTSFGVSTPYSHFEQVWGKETANEIRALIAVARAARKLEAQSRDWMNGKIVFNADIAINAVGDALARLDRASER